MTAALQNARPSGWTLSWLGLNGLVRQGRAPAEIITAIRGKDAENRKRRWPDWRNTDPNLAIEHERSSAVVCDPDMAGVRS